MAQPGNERLSDWYGKTKVRREQLLSRNVKRFPGGLVFRAHRLLYHSTLGSRVIKKKRRDATPRLFRV